MSYNPTWGSAGVPSQILRGSNTTFPSSVMTDVTPVATLDLGTPGMGSNTIDWSTVDNGDWIDVDFLCRMWCLLGPAMVANEFIAVRLYSDAGGTPLDIVNISGAAAINLSPIAEIVGGAGVVRYRKRFYFGAGGIRNALWTPEVQTRTKSLTAGTPRGADNNGGVFGQSDAAAGVKPAGAAALFGQVTYNNVVAGRECSVQMLNLDITLHKGA